MTCQIELIFKILFICIAVGSLIYLWDQWKQNLFHILNGYAHICWHTGSYHGPWNSRVVSLLWPLLVSQSWTRWLAMDFQCFCRVLPNHTYLTCGNFVCQHLVMAETTLKPRTCTFIVPISNLYWETWLCLCWRYFQRSKHKAKSCRDFSLQH